MNERQELIDLLIAREEIKDANAYDRAECLADYLLENDYRKRSVGEWVHGENGIAHCSECGNEVPEHAITPYCLLCGAYMEGEIDE